jgi:hypothetical protein
MILPFWHQQNAKIPKNWLAHPRGALGKRQEQAYYDEHTPSEPNSPFSEEANLGDLDTRNMAAQTHGGWVSS